MTGKLMPRRAFQLAVLILVATTVACAHVPKEAVNLSERMGADLRTVHTANRELALSYYATLRARADAVVDREYRPFVISQTLDGLLSDIDEARKPKSELDPLDVMQVYVTEAIARVDSFRAELHAPIDSQEREVLRRIDDAHDALEQGNAAITAHLISLRKVEAEQDTLMNMAGLPANTREQFIEAITGASSEVGRLLAGAKAGSASMDSLPNLMRRALAQHKH